MKLNFAVEAKKKGEEKETETETEKKQGSLNIAFLEHA